MLLALLGGTVIGLSNSCQIDRRPGFLPTLLRVRTGESLSRQFPGAGRCLGRGRIPDDRAQAARRDVAHSLYFCGVWHRSNRIAWHHVRCRAASNRLLPHDLHLDPVAGADPAVDRTLDIQLGTALSARGAGLDHNAGRANRLGGPGLFHLKRSAHVADHLWRGSHPGRDLYLIQEVMIEHLFPYGDDAGGLGLVILLPA